MKHPSEKALSGSELRCFRFMVNPTINHGNVIVPVCARFISDAGINLDKC